MIKKLLLLTILFVLSLNNLINAACTMTAVCPGNGNWTSASSWTPSGCGALVVPGNNMTIVIPSCATVNIDNGVNGTTYSNLTIIVNGTLNFNVGTHLNLSGASSVSVQGSGKITGANSGDQIVINGTNVWTNAPTPITCCVVLPIELLSFTATQESKSVLLNWSTATEINNDFFTIEKSIDGINFEVLGTIDGAGNSTSVLNYSFVDNSPTLGVSYYYLRRTDFNGESGYSGIVSVDYEENNDFSFKIVPNPNDGNNFSFSVKSEKGTEVQVVICDIMGRIVFQNNTILESSGENKYPFSPYSALPSGIYILKASSGKNAFNGKLIVN